MKSAMHGRTQRGANWSSFWETLLMIGPGYVACEPILNELIHDIRDSTWTDELQGCVEGSESAVDVPLDLALSFWLEGVQEALRDAFGPLISDDVEQLIDTLEFTPDIASLKNELLLALMCPSDDCD